MSPNPFETQTPVGKTRGVMRCQRDWGCRLGGLGAHESQRPAAVMPSARCQPPGKCSGAEAAPSPPEGCLGSGVTGALPPDNGLEQALGGAQRD